MKLAFVGTGRMGASIARRLREERFAVAAVFDADRELALKLAGELGCEIAASLAAATASADVIITAVSDDEAMEQIFAEKGDTLLDAAKGRLFINFATITPETQQLVEQRAEKRGAQAVEVSVASTIPQSRERSPYLLCAGKPAAVEQARPILEKLAVSMKYVGPAGEAAKIKALVSMVRNMNTAALAEALGLADALKLDLALVREVFSQTGADSRVLHTDGEHMQKREHTVVLSAAHAAKDSAIALRLAREAGLALPLTEATKAQFDKLVFEGLGDHDKSAIAELTFKDRRADA